MGSLTSLCTESFVSPHLQSVPGDGRARDADRIALGRLLSGTPLGWQVVALKLRAPDGRILYSTNPAFIGRKFKVKPALASAFAGKVHSELTNLRDPDNELERWSRLIETYAPSRAKHRNHHRSRGVLPDAR